jgi:DNA-binding CsgD family transcriptional regulator
VLIVDVDCAKQIPACLVHRKADHSVLQTLLIIRGSTRSGEPLPGASRWVSRHDKPKELIEAVRALIDGRSVGRRQSSSSSIRHDRIRAPDLTEREYAVLRLLVRAETNEAIAQALGISPNTVRTHVHNVLTKLNVHSRAGAIASAAQLGLPGPPNVNPEPSTAGRQ